MQWLLVFVAGCFEVGWAVGMKYSDGFTRLIPSLLTAAGYIASLYFLTLAVKHLPLGSAYAVWTGIGTVGAFVMGALLFKEIVTVPQIICVLMIIAGIVGLRLLTQSA
jgi:Membrane transporters of cations and cationic drugs